MEAEAIDLLPYRLIAEEIRVADAYHANVAQSGKSKTIGGGAIRVKAV